MTPSRRPRDAAPRRRRGRRGRRRAHAVRGAHRVFVLERADTMNDEAANALLKTLEEPPSYVVLLLLTDRPTPGAADDRQPLPAGALRPAVDRRSSRSSSSRTASRRTPREAAARLSLGDGEKALALALGDGPALRDAAEHLARAPLHGRATRTTVARDPRARRGARRRGQGGGRDGARRGAPVPARRRSTSGARPSSPSAPAARSGARARRRSTTRSSSPACGTATSPASPRSAPELAFHSDRAQELQEDAGRDAATLHRAQELVDDTRAALILNVSEELACEALAYRLEEALSSSSSSA